MTTESIRIDDEIRDLCPPLSDEEAAGLEADILAEGCRDALVVWEETGILLDGHNRLRICEGHRLPYQTRMVSLADKRAARIWVRHHQLRRRNLTPAWQIELQLGNKADLAEQGRERQAHGKTAPGRRLLSSDNKGVAQPPETTNTGGCGSYEEEEKKEPTPPPPTPPPKHDTRAIIAAAAGVSTGTLAQAEIVRREAPELWDKAKAGETTIGAAYRKVRQRVAREDAVKRVESTEALEAKALCGQYDVLVIDPPWPMGKIERDERPNQAGFDYPTMNKEELAGLALPVAEDAHVWLWTTHKHLPMAFRLLTAWGLKYVCTFVWHKPDGFQPFGLPQYNCEFALYARHGTPKFIDTKALPLCFTAPRGAHSEKPEEFYATLRRVTAGRRLDMFNRRQIDGFDGWGKEAQ